MNIKLPDYSNCIVNLANSILGEFGIKEEGRGGLAQLNPFLEKNYKNIVVLLLDGMGTCILEKNLAADGFFNTHLVDAYSSVFPPTTVAATPFAEPYPKTLSAICDRIGELCSKPGKKYIYGYWSEPDDLMHQVGCYAPQAKALVQQLEEQVKHLCENLENTLVIVTVDHGHMDSKCVGLDEYPKIRECLLRLPSIEPRALNLFVKPEKREQFEAEFQKEFGGRFLLWTKERVLNEQIFGTGNEHPCFRDMLGDYLAIAIDDVSVFATKEEADLYIGVHAGLTEDEMAIPLIVIEKK